jgi:hypothetical protein
MSKIRIPRKWKKRLKKSGFVIESLIRAMRDVEGGRTAPVQKLIDEL